MFWFWKSAKGAFVGWKHEKCKRASKYVLIVTVTQIWNSEIPCLCSTINALVRVGSSAQQRCRKSGWTSVNSGRVVIPALYAGMLRQRMNSLYQSDSALCQIYPRKGGLTQGLCNPQAFLIKTIQKLWLIQNSVASHRWCCRGENIRYPALSPCSAVCPLEYPDAKLQRGTLAVPEPLWHFSYVMTLLVQRRIEANTG